LMEDHDIGFLPVVKDEVSAGVVTDRDLAIRIVAAGRDPLNTTVAEVMSFGPGVEGNVDLSSLPGVATLPEDTPVEEAIHFMDEKHVRRVTVHDKNYRIVGVVSRVDLGPSTHDPEAVSRSE
jgi:CBS domain-containing protein